VINSLLLVAISGGIGAAMRYLVSLLGGKNDLAVISLMAFFVQ